MSKKIPNEYGYLSHPRKSKRRSTNSRTSPHEGWYNERDNSQDPSEDEVPGMEFTPVYWQQHRLSQAQAQPPPPPPAAHPAHHNGQRLFTAMSDPSVCGYSVPVTYAMEPVSLPPMYHFFQPVVRPNFRPCRGRTRTALPRVPNGPPGVQENSANGYSSLQENGWNNCAPGAYQNGDYASLPPTANNDNRNNGEELSAEHRRYSDPGLGPADIAANARENDSDSEQSEISVKAINRNHTMYLSLVDQMTKMKEVNSQLFKELHQAKTDLDNVKTEINQLKQNVPPEYKPGMFTDIIKEIRDASRAKEEAMLSKMRQLMDSQQCQKNTELEQLKSQLDAVTRASDERVVKLEKEIASLRLGLNSCNESSINQQNPAEELAAFEEENLALRRELQEARRQAKAKQKQKQQQQQQQHQNQQRRPSATATTTMQHQSSSSSDDDEEDFNYDNACNNSIGPTKGPVTDL